MAVLSNELRNLLTEESIGSILSAGCAPNGHLIPAQDEADKKQQIINMSSQEKEVLPEVESNMQDIKSYFDENIQKHEKTVETLVSKMNEIIKTLNMLEKKVSFLESKPAVKTEQAENPQQILEEKKEEVKEEKKNIHPRSMASLPPELSIENVFSCNGKKFN